MTATRFYAAMLVVVGLGCSSKDEPTLADNPADDAAVVDAKPPKMTGQDGPKADAASVDSPAEPPADAASSPSDVAPTQEGDAAVTPPGPPPGALESVEVSATGDAVMLKTSLAMGEVFLLKAAGVVDVGGQKIDAEYAFGSGMPADEVGGVDVGIDIGVPQIHAMVHNRPTPPGPGRMKWYAYGAYREDHAYYMTLTGAGHALSVKLAKPAGTTGGSGSIRVSIFQLSPAPPQVLGTELETVMVPVAKMMVTSNMSPASDKLYVLQASGRGKVGGGGTHQGDAEYMDWTETGMGANEGEAGADFGIGVDEVETHLMPYGPGGYKPRLRWWGPWRMDHTYYMVFTGTGKPIQFFYFDSGYPDNSPTDKLSVKIFNAP
jgi:hypothetical protein